MNTLLPELNIPYVWNHAGRKKPVRDIQGGIWKRKPGDKDYEGPKSGFWPALLCNSFYSFRGLLISSLFNEVKEDYNNNPFNKYDFKGFAISGGVNYLGSSSGIAISGLTNRIRGHFKGLGLTGLINDFTSTSKGILFAGGINRTFGGLRGISISTLGNYAAANGGFSVQIGAINKIKHYSPTYLREKPGNWKVIPSFVLQIGLHNTIGDKSLPIINFRYKKVEHDPYNEPPRK